VTDIEHINDVDTLKEVARLQALEIERLYRKLAEKTEALARLEGKSPSESLQLELEALKSQLDEQQRKLYGKSSERRGKREQKKPRKKRTKFGNRPQPDLPIEPLEHTLPVDEQDCPSCGGQLELMAEVSEDSEEITVVERQYKIVRHKRRKYRCRCNSAVVTAPGPHKLVPGGRYSLDFAIQVAIDKYLLHLPLARQVREMATLGLIVDSQTLWEQLQHLATLLEPCYYHIRNYILGADVIGADETWWPVLQKKSSKKWWVWAMSTHDAVFYRVDESRSREAARRCLDDFQGIVMCDGYSSYQSLAKARDDLTLAHCWSHVRRKFFAAHKNYPDECEPVLDWIDTLFAIEKEAPDPDRLDGDAKSDALTLRARLREERSRPIIDKLQQWAYEQAALPKSDLGKAIKYMGNQWQGLVRFLDDPIIPLHNNHMERELRNWVLGRKNHYGSRSRRGTEVAALFYTLIETAQLHGSNPAEYLRSAAIKAIEAIESSGTHAAMLPTS